MLKSMEEALSRKGRGGRSENMAKSQRAAECLMQQRLFQRFERGEFLLVEGFEALGFDGDGQEARHDCTLLYA